MAARTYALRKGGGWLEQDNVAETARLARRAAELGKDDAVALGTAGMALSFVVGDHDYGKALTDRAIALNPNFAWAWLFSGWVRLWLGEPDEVIDRVARAMRLNPSDPHSQTVYHAMAIAHFFAGRYSEAASWAERAMQEKPNFVRPFCVAAASYAHAGQTENARAAMARVRQIDPDLRLSDARELFPMKRPEDCSKWENGLRLAGLPE
jgi:tetratricopeptide (TPR) repeat protein